MQSNCANSFTLYSNLNQAFRKNLPPPATNDSICSRYQLNHQLHLAPPPQPSPHSSLTSFINYSNYPLSPLIVSCRYKVLHNLQRNGFEFETHIVLQDEGIKWLVLLIDDSHIFESIYARKDLSDAQKIWMFALARSKNFTHFFPPKSLTVSLLGEPLRVNVQNDGQIVAGFEQLKARVGSAAKARVKLQPAAGATSAARSRQVVIRRRQIRHLFVLFDVIYGRRPPVDERDRERANANERENLMSVIQKKGWNGLFDCDWFRGRM